MWNFVNRIGEIFGHKSDVNLTFKREVITFHDHRKNLSFDTRVNWWTKWIVRKPKINQRKMTLFPDPRFKYE